MASKEEQVPVPKTSADEDVSPPTSAPEQVDDEVEQPKEEAGKPKKSGLISRIWAASGLNVGMVLIMFKGAMPPIIALAANQTKTWANKYTTLGYLVAIMSLLSFPILPRAKFTQTMILNIIFVCLGAAIALLEMYCAVKAREHSTHAASTSTQTGASGGQEAKRYNASASAVSAIWLCFTIYTTNALRAKRPQLMFPVIIYSIFTIIASSYAPLYTNMTQVKAFVKRLLEAFLTGFGIASAISFFVIPTTSRMIVEKQIAGFLKMTTATLGAHQEYLMSIIKYRQEAQSWSKEESMELNAEAKKMKGLLSEMAALFGKINAEVTFAKREVAYGKLAPEDYTKIIDLSRQILMPIAGMTTFIDIIQSVKMKKMAHKKLVDSSETIEALRQLEIDDWDEAAAKLRATYSNLISGMRTGILHILYTLQLEKPPKKVKDVEQNGSTPGPGDKEFADYLEKRLQEFAEDRKTTLQDWCEEKGITLPTTFWDSPDHVVSMGDLKQMEQNIRQHHTQQQLYLVLYVQYLTHAIGHNILQMVRWADSKVEDGTMTKKRVIVPAVKRFKKWIETVFAEDTEETEEGFATGLQESPDVWAGDSYRKRKDPEHLPPATFIQRVTNPIRLIPKFLRSDASSYGFRVMVATMSLAILDYLSQTQAFFSRQRGVWSVIMIAISMGSSAGDGVFGVLMKTLGTAIAMCTSLILWYMTDHIPGAILPVMYIFTVPFFYVVVIYPKYAQAAVISMVTPLLIIGYELQVHRLGLKVAESNGQPAYPIYELAPYRLAAVVAGLGVAFFWTYFPYPITTRLTVRKQVGSSIYLLANYYSCVHTTMNMRLTQSIRAEDEQKKGTPAYKLLKARQKVFSKLVVLYSNTKVNLSLTKLEPTFGGKFPRETYSELIYSIQHMFNYINLVSYATNTFVTSSSGDETEWLRDFRKFAADVDLLTHDITSMLCLLSASLSNSAPLPPYLKLSRSFDLDQRLRSVDPELLSIQHISEPCYAAFAVLQVASSLITEELDNTISLVRQLVGEVDFSFHSISTSGDGSAKSMDSGSTAASLQQGDKEKEVKRD